MGSQVIFPFLWENVYMKDSFGTRLRELRSERGVGQVALSKAIGVGKSVVSLWELDKCDPTLTNLIKLAEYFDVSIDFLAGLSDE